MNAIIRNPDAGEMADAIAQAGISEEAALAQQAQRERQQVAAGNIGLPDTHRSEAHKPSMPKDYLGDSVYATFDGWCITLTTENGYGPSNTIMLEPEVLAALDRFRERVFLK